MNSQAFLSFSDEDKTRHIKSSFHILWVTLLIFKICLILTFLLSPYDILSSGESFELCDKGLRGNFLKDIQQRSFPSRGGKKKGNSMMRDLYFKKKATQNNIEKRETLRLNLNNNEFIPISI